MAATVLLLEPRDECRTAHATTLHSAGNEAIAIRDSRSVLDALETPLPDVIVAGLDSCTRGDHLTLSANQERSPNQEHFHPAHNSNIGRTGCRTRHRPRSTGAHRKESDSGKLVAAIQGYWLGRADLSVRRYQGEKTSKQPA